MSAETRAADARFTARWGDDRQDDGDLPQRPWQPQAPLIPRRWRGQVYILPLRQAALGASWG